MEPRIINRSQKARKMDGVQRLSKEHERSNSSGNALHLVPSILKSVMKGGYKDIAPKKQNFDKSVYDMEYQKANLLQVKFSLNKKHDSDIIEKLQSVPNRTGYIKKLIREDMKKDDNDPDQ